MRPHSNGSSTIGVKKSVVTTMARSSRSRYTAASSLVSRPTSRPGWRGAPPRPRASPSTVRRSAGDSLQAQPAPCENCVRRNGSWTDEAEVMPSGYDDGRLARSARAGGRLVQADVVDAHVVTRMGGIDDGATTGVDAHVTREPDDVTRLERVHRHPREHRDLGLGVVRHVHADLTPGHHREA